jgi:SAM-dependent methyltransferase
MLRQVPLPWLSSAIDLLELLERFRRPLSAPLYLGEADACLAAVREKYDLPVETGQYEAKVQAGLYAPEREILLPHLRPGSRVLNVGCGAGREGLALARAGFRVTGVDLAPRMIAAARDLAVREGLDIAFHVRNATAIDRSLGTFDFAYWSDSYQHVPGRALRVEALRRIRQTLAPGGSLVLSVAYNAQGILSRRRLVDVLRAIARSLPLGWRVSEPGDSYMYETSGASDPQSPCFFHRFAGAGEARSEITAAGYEATEVAAGWWICRPLPE